MVRRQLNTHALFIYDVACTLTCFMKYVQCVSESNKSSNTKSQRAAAEKEIIVEESSPPLFDDELNDEVSYIVI